MFGKLASSVRNLSKSSALATRSVRCMSSGAQMSNQEMVDLCKEYTIWSWSAQKAVNPIPMTRAEVCHPQYRRQKVLFSCRY